MFIGGSDHAQQGPQRQDQRGAEVVPRIPGPPGIPSAVFRPSPAASPRIDPPPARLALPKARLVPRLGVLLGASGATSMTPMDSDRRTKEDEATDTAATQTLEMSGETSKNKESGSVWESNPLTAFFKPPTGFEDQGPHQRCKHSRNSKPSDISATTFLDSVYYIAWIILTFRPC